MTEATDHATRADVRALDQKIDADVRALDQKIDATKTEILRVIDHKIEGVSDQVRHVGILLEQMRSDFRAFGDALSAKASKTDVENVEKRLGDRVSLLESAVWDNSREISKNTDDVRLVRNEVAQLRLQFDRRDLRGDELERRIAEIEKRIGISR